MRAVQATPWRPPPARTSPAAATCVPLGPQASAFEDPQRDRDPEGRFEPGVLNTTVFIVLHFAQVGDMGRRLRSPCGPGSS